MNLDMFCPYKVECLKTVRYRGLLSLAKVIISECFCGIVATFSGYYVKGLCRQAILGNVI
nr:MAG TPA: hypothetical protein [Caudoviricetes sp.]